MSASTNKKLRKAAREAGNDKKLIAAQEEAAKKAKSKRNWTIGTIAVITLCAVIIFLGSGILYKTTAVTIGDEKYSAAETNFRIGNQFQNFYSQYGSYASLFGLDTSMGVSGLSEQDCMMREEGGTWKDYFMDLAETEMIQIKALCDYAEANGISLTEEEIDNIEVAIGQNESYATVMGYNSVQSFYSLNYGNGVNSDLVRKADIDSTLASKVLTQYSESLNYSAAELEEKYQSYNGEMDMYKYAYYYVAAETETVTAEDGTETTQVVEGGLEAAKVIAESIVKAYEQTEGEQYRARFEQALADSIEGATATYQLTNPSSMGVYKDWLMADHEPGTAGVVANNTNGYYAIVFIDHSDNHYKVAQVRHILLEAEADENGEYTEAAKAEALARAEEVLAEWKAGEATEDSFAVMAGLFSQDTGSNSNGGLYDQVIKGQMVDEFDAFCFGDHKSGDTAIVYGEAAGYAGYHVMYYVGEGEMYSDIIAKSDLVNAAVSEWLGTLTEGLEAEYGFGYRFVA